MLDDLSRGSAARLHGLRGELDVITADVRDAGAVAKAAEGVDSVCHLAAVNGTEHFYRRPDTVLEVGVKGMMNVLDACQAHRIPELIVVSSSEVYHQAPEVPTGEAVPLTIPDPRNPRYSYAGSKLISELLTLNYGRARLRRAVIVRPHNVYGPDMGWEHVIPQLTLRVRALCREQAGAIRLPIRGTGRETRAFVYIDDFIDGLWLAMTKGEHLGIYHIGTTEEIAIRAVAEAIGRQFGREVTVVPGEPAAGSPGRRCPDIARLSQLGYRPNVTFSEGLPRVVRWCDEHAPEPEALSPAPGAGVGP